MADNLVKKISATLFALVRYCPISQKRAVRRKTKELPELTNKTHKQNITCHQETTNSIISILVDNPEWKAMLDATGPLNSGNWGKCRGISIENITPRTEVMWLKHHIYRFEFRGFALTPSFKSIPGLLPTISDDPLATQQNKIQERNQNVQGSILTRSSGRRGELIIAKKMQNSRPFDNL